MTNPLQTGGCQCGAVRYAAAVQPDSAHLCHCRMCQKAVGGLFAALVGVDKASLSWTRGAPSTFFSSQHIERGFCSACGTPLFYREATGGDLSMTIGSFDRAADIRPQWQVGTEAAMPWFADLPGLHSYGATEANDDAEMTAGIVATNRQHPDHDTTTWPPEGVQS